jgi:hypothetical protein
MKRVLLDQGLAPAVAGLLRESGWDAVHVSEVGLGSADDTEILENARAADRVCVTLDHDFHASSCSREIGATVGGPVACSGPCGIRASGPDSWGLGGLRGGNQCRGGSFCGSDTVRVRGLPLR